MTGTKQMKRSTLVSVIAIALCSVLMLGATWAWFSDEVLNAGNTIATDGFAIDLTLEGASVDGAAPVFECNNWKPGDSAAKILTLENKEDLALIWSATVTQENAPATGANLADMIKVYYKVGATEVPTDLTTWDGGDTLADLTAEIAEDVLAGSQSETIGIALVMDENAGNDYQNLTATFKIAVSAIQANPQ